jgi:Tol biopolymer transport system component
VKALTDALNAVARGETPDLDLIDKTMVASAKTVATKLPPPDTKTMLAKPGQESGPASAASRKKSGLWIGLGGAALLVCLVAVAGVVRFRNRIPFLAAHTPTRPPVVSMTDTPEVRLPTNTDTPGVLPPLAASDTSTPTFTSSPSPSPTVQGLPRIGGADLIAFLSDNDIWVMGVDGSDLTQITKDRGEKYDLQWSPDGQSLFYISGKCIWTVPVPEGVAAQITCFTAATYLEAFEISPDGSQVAISLNRVVYVVPFDLTAISNARTWGHLIDMKGCFTYNQDSTKAPPKGVRWSSDGKSLAINTNSVDAAGRKVDLISIFDISTCNSTNPFARDNFPATRFAMTGYSTNPVIPSFDWDGNTLFVLNSKIRFELGYLYAYNMETKRSDNLDPIDTLCCYTAARFSPDGSFLLFVYQNINNAKTQLYYVSYGSIGSGVTYTPLTLPDGFFSAPNDHLDATLRPAKP